MIPAFSIQAQTCTGAASHVCTNHVPRPFKRDNWPSSRNRTKGDSTLNTAAAHAQMSPRPQLPRTPIATESSLSCRQPIIRSACSRQCNNHCREKPRGKITQACTGLGCRLLAHLTTSRCCRSSMRIGTCDPMDGFFITHPSELSHEANCNSRAGHISALPSRRSSSRVIYPRRRSGTPTASRRRSCRTAPSGIRRRRAAPAGRRCRAFVQLSRPPPTCCRLPDAPREDLPPQPVWRGCQRQPLVAAAAPRTQVQRSLRFLHRHTT